MLSTQKWVELPMHNVGPKACNWFVIRYVPRAKDEPVQITEHTGSQYADRPDVPDEKDVQLLWVQATSRLAAKSEAHRAIFSGRHLKWLRDEGQALLSGRKRR